MGSSLLQHSKVYHVRSVTQGDVIRADAKEIPRIFQLLYAGEGASHRPDEQLDSTMLVSSNEERPGTIIHKGKLHLFTYLPLSLSHTHSLSFSPALFQGMSSCTSRITCQQPARSAPSRCGNCSSRRRRTNARGKQWKINKSRRYK